MFNMIEITSGIVRLVPLLLSQQSIKRLTADMFVCRFKHIDIQPEQ